MAESSNPDSLAESVVSWAGKELGIDLNEIFAAAENDWSLIVKLHAMIETTLNTVLLSHFGFPELKRIIAKLDTSNPQIGKIAFAKALKILNNNAAIFIQKLSELRNLCVHDIRNFNFDVVKHLETLASDKRGELIKAINRDIKPEWRDCAPQIGLKIATANVIIQLRIHHLKCELRDREAEVLRAKAERFDEQNQSTPKKE